jgi:hypothetical protein
MNLIYREGKLGPEAVVSPRLGFLTLQGPFPTCLKPSRPTFPLNFVLLLLKGLIPAFCI